MNLPDIPKTLGEALNGKDSHKWKEAILTEINQLEEKGTFKILDWIPQNIKGAAKSKFVFDIKYDADMSIRWKARLVLCGYSQIFGLNYDKTYAPTIKKGTILIVLHLITVLQWTKVLSDVGGAFVEAKNDFQDIRMILPREVFGQCVVLVLNSLYGEKQAAFLWNEGLKTILVVHLGCEQLVADQCVYIKRNDDGESSLIIMVFVDDMLVSAPNNDIIKEFTNEFKLYVMNVKVYDDIKKYLGMELRYSQDNSELCVHQQEYVTTTYKKMMLQEEFVYGSSMRERYRSIPMSPQYPYEWKDADEEMMNDLYSTTKILGERENKLLQQ